MALEAGIPVIFSAAGLKLVMTRLLSTVKTPSAMELKMTLKNLRSWDESLIFMNISFRSLQDKRVMVSGFENVGSFVIPRSVTRKAS